MRLRLIYCFILLPVIVFGQGSIKGHITDLNTKEPVGDGKVKLYYEDYNAGDTVREKLYNYFDMSAGMRDTIYIRPKYKLLDSATCDAKGQFSFTSLTKGYYRITYSIKVDILKGKHNELLTRVYGNRWQYRFDERARIPVDQSPVKIELTPKVYCEYLKYRDMDSCPVCKKKSNLLKVRYGLPEYDPANVNRIKSEQGEYWIGDCVVDALCYARWYCRKCKKLF